MKKLKVLSLCDGMAGGLLAFTKLEVPVEYVAVEIEASARAIADDNFPEISRTLGNDVFKLQKEDVQNEGPFDFVIFGSCCQSVSPAGKRQGLDGASGILLKCLDVLSWCKEQNPELKYLIENVKMERAFLAEFNEVIGHRGTLLNSTLVSAQKRERWYWTNLEDNIVPPSDRNIFLPDILEPQTVSHDWSFPFPISNILEAKILVPNSDVPMPLKNYFTKKQNIASFNYSSSSRPGKIIERRVALNGKANTLTTQLGCGGNKSINGVLELMPNGQFMIRKLSVRECARAQTIPDSFRFSAVSKNQAYHAIGNGWTIDMIVHILSQLLISNSDLDAL